MQNPSTNDRQKPHEKPRLVLGRPLRRPGETREQAAKRLAQEMLASMKPVQEGDRTGGCADERPT